MAVRIDELHSTIDTVDSEALLTPETLDRIVRAVLVALADQQRARETLDAEVALLTVVEQQRKGRA